MQVQVRLFSILRDCLPSDAEGGKASIGLTDGATLADLITRLGIDRKLGLAPDQITSQAGWQLLVSDRFEADMTRVLQDGDEVKILPPVSGG
jgi:molybdopterin converting factor small subunit